MSREQAGQSLSDVVVAVAIVATVLAAATGASISAMRRFGPDAQRTALEDAAQRELHVAVDILKYQGGAIAPAAVATTVPMPGGSPLPAHLSVTTTSLAGGGVSVSLTATSDLDPSKTVTLSATIAAPAPMPSATLAAPDPAPAPTGAP